MDHTRCPSQTRSPVKLRRSTLRRGSTISLSTFTRGICWVFHRRACVWKASHMVHRTSQTTSKVFFLILLGPCLLGTVVMTLGQQLDLWTTEKCTIWQLGNTFPVANRIIQASWWMSIDELLTSYFWPMQHYANTSKETKTQEIDLPRLTRSPAWTFYLRWPPLPAQMSSIRNGNASCPTGIPILIPKTWLQGWDGG